MQSDYVLEMRQITKTYPGVRALNKVDFKLKRGRVTALMGENGAGKSTLMKVLAGIVDRDSGEILYKGKSIEFSSPKEAMRAGISMIHQELSSLLEMTVAENIFLGREFHFKHLPVIDYQKTYAETRKLLARVGLTLDPQLKMKDLTVSQMQMVEIAKAISFNSDIIIMDEPTSAITTREVEKLFKIIHQFKEENRSIVYITHKMDEVFQIADDITVFRDGCLVGSYEANAITDQELIRLMVNRDLTEIFPKRDNKKLGETVLKVETISKKGKFDKISFEVRSGEILGLAGLMGAGRTEIVESIFGIHPLDEGDIFVLGEKVPIRKPKDAIRQGIALVTEDRKLTGLVLGMDIKDNMTLPSTLNFCYGKAVIKRGLVRRMCEEFRSKLRVKMVSQDQAVASLSGGNQQKVVLAKWLMMKPKVLIFDEPTRGIDVGAKSEFYSIIADLAKAGTAILFISSEMPEMLGMCDRIISIYQGRQSGEVKREDATQELLLKYATGLN